MFGVKIAISIAYMKKTVCLLTLFILLVSKSGISDVNSDYNKIYQVPDAETTHLSDKITQLDNGLLVKTGIRNSSIPFVQVYASNGLSFTKWELPFDKEISDCLYPMATACGDEICLFLNDKLEFFLPDGEYSHTEYFHLSIVSDTSRRVLDMDFNKNKNEISLLVKCDRKDPLYWYVYSTNGSFIKNIKWTETSLEDSVFLTRVDGEILLGNMLNGYIFLYHSDGTQFTDSQIYERLNKIYDSLKILFGKKTNICVTDIEFAKSNTWIQCNKGMLCFDLEGEILHAPLPLNSELNCNISGRLNDDTYFCLVNDNNFVTFNSAGAQTYRCFFKNFFASCDKLISIEQDSSNFWWVCYQEFSGSSTQSFLSRLTANGSELNKWNINNEEIPAVFASDYQNPLALVGKKNVYPLPGTSALAEPLSSWPHFIITNLNDKIAAAADEKGLLYLLNSTAKGNVQVFSLTGSYVRTYNINPVCLSPAKEGSVTALISKQSFKYYLRNLYKDGTVSVRYQVKNNNNWKEEPLSLTQLESGVIVIGLSNEIAFCAPVQKNKISLANGMEIKVSPRGTPLAIDYRPEQNSMSLYSFGWQRKSPGTFYKKLSRYGKKLSKKTGDFHARKKIYKKIFNFINKEKSKLSLALKYLGDSQPKLNIYAYLAAKKIKTQNIYLESFTAKTGENPIGVGNLKLSRGTNCRIECSRLKKFSIEDEFSGQIKTWFGDIEKIDVAGQINNAVFTSRKNIRKLSSKEKISHAYVRAGISPLGYTGFLGDISLVKFGNTIDNSEFIACADEGNTAGWDNDTIPSQERFSGSIISVRSKMTKSGSKILPEGKVLDSLYVTKHPINFLIQKKERTTVIVNGKKQ